MSPTLFAIRDDVEALEALLFELGGDVTDEQAAAAIDQWLAENREALRVKLDSYGALIREHEALGKSRKEEAARLSALAKSDERLVERLKERLRWYFEAEGLERLETQRFKFSLANNGGLAPLILHAEPDELPEEFQRVSVAADNERIRAALQAGRSLEFAEFGERGRHLRVR